MENRDTIHDTIFVYVEKDISKVNDSTLVEEVLHRYDKISDDLKGHDMAPVYITIVSLIIVIISILNRRKKNKKDGTKIHG
jgi:hypothetical protein